MDEFEFFRNYDVKGVPWCRGVEIWRRDSGIYGEIRPVNMADFDVIHCGKSVGLRKSFAGALKLFIAQL